MDEPGTSKDDIFMEMAFQLAQDALDNEEVPVGCIFTLDGQEVGSGRNEVNATGDPTAHAEMVAVRKMRKLDWFATRCHELELFVSLEPCIMCAAAMYELRIKRIVYGAMNPRFGGIVSVGNKDRYSAEHIIELICLPDPQRSINMLKQFYEMENPKAPEDKRKPKKPRK